MSTESSLWTWLTAAKRVLRDDLDMQRVEDLTRAGRPDVEGVYRGEAFLLENKCCPRRPVAPIRPKFRPAQLPWMKRRWKSRGFCAAFVQVGDGAGASRFLVPAPHLDLLAAGIHERELIPLSLCPPTARPDEVVMAAVEAASRLRLGQWVL